MTSSATGEDRKSPAVRAGVVLWIVFVAVLPLAPALLSGQVPWVSDIRNVFGPLRAFSQHGRAADGIALWNPWSACGIPHATDLQVAAWYPPNWIIDRIPVPVAMTVEIVAHLVLLGGLTYLAARLRGARRLPALAATTLFQVSGAVLHEAQAASNLRSLAWSPGLAVAGLLIARGDRRAGFLAGAGAWAMACLAGHPQFPLVFLPVAAALAWGSTESAGEGGVAAGVRRVLVLAFAVVTGAAIAGVALLPAALYGPHTQRVLGFDLGVLQAEAPADAIARMVFARSAWGSAATIGIGTLALALLGLFSGARRNAALLVAAGIAFLVYLAPHAGRLAVSIPPWSAFHYPARNFACVAFVCALLAADGLSAWTGECSDRARRGAAAGAAVLAVVACGVSGFDLSARDLAILVCGVLTAGIVAASPSRVRIAPVAAALALLAAAEPLLTFGRTLGRDGKSMAPAEAAAEPADLAAVPASGRDGTYRLNQGGFVATHSQLRPLQWRIMCSRAHIALLPLAYLDLASVADRGALVPRHPLLDPYYYYGAEAWAPPAILDLMGTKWAAGYRRILGPDTLPVEGWTPVAPGLWERTSRMRVVEVVRAAEFRPDETAVAAAIRAPEFAPWERIVLEGSAGQGDGAGAPAPGPLPEIEATRLRGDGFDVDLRPGAASWLHASYNFLPGFTCTVDGAPAAIRRAHLAFMAVRLPAGARRVSFRYEPPGLAAGAWITAGGVLLAAAVAVALGLTARERAGGPR